MTINLIRELKNTVEKIEVEAGRSARANFPKINFENAVLIINGAISTPDTIIKDGDVVTLRLIPADLTETPWWVATFIIPFGFIIQPAEIAYQARQQAEESERELEKIKKLTNSSSVDNRPFLRGATNSLATGKSQPYFCGRNLMTPYLFSKPYYKISGTDGATQEVFDVIEGGFRGLVFSKLGLGDVTIKDFSDTEPQNGVYTINDGAFANGVVEIRQDGSLFSSLTQLNYKTVSTVANREIVRDVEVSAGEGEYVQFNLDPNAKNVEICINFPYGLYTYDSNNDRIATTVTITPEYSLDGGSTWAAFTFTQNGTLSNVFTRNALKALRYVAAHEFTLADYTTLAANNQACIYIRVRSNGNDDSKIKNDCFVYYYQTRIFDPAKSSAPAGVLDDNGAAGLVDCLNVEDRERAYTCMLGLRLVSTDNNKDKDTKINFVATSTARTWNGSAWSESKSPTRNPAAIALEILTTDVHPASRYADDEIDLAAFGAFYEYCENNDLYYDQVITQQQKKDAALQTIADVCSVAFYKDIYGRRSVAIDQAQENSIAVYNPQNIISLTNKKTFARRIDALRIKYIDSENDTYKENTYTVTRLENGVPVTINENSIIKELTATGITRYAQVVKYGRRLMAVDELRPITTTLSIGAEGVYYTPFAKISIQDPSLNADAQDTLIQSVTYSGGLLQSIKLKNPVTLDPLLNYGIIINVAGSAGAVPLALRVTGSGTTDELTLIDDYSISEATQPEAGNVAAVGALDANGEFSNVVHDFVITRIARTANDFNLDLQEYNEAVYEPGTIPAYKPIVNNTPTPAAGEIPSDAATIADIEERVDRANADVVQAAVDTIQQGYRFTNIYNVRPVESTLEEIIAKIDDDARNSSASISISETEILLQVQDMEQELTGLISVQAGAVTALVEGGGASGQMSLTLNLPVMIDATKRAELIAASTEAKVNAVYGLVENTAYYGIKSNASNTAVKALWDDAVSAGLIASQIELNADQIFINGDVIVNDDNKIKAALLEVENLLTTDISVKDKGVIHSDNYNGTIDSNGNITTYGSAGWAIDHAGRAIFNNIISRGVVEMQRGYFTNQYYSAISQEDSPLLSELWDYILDNIDERDEVGSGYYRVVSGIMNIMSYDKETLEFYGNTNFIINHMVISYEYNSRLIYLYGMCSYNNNGLRCTGLSSIVFRSEENDYDTLKLITANAQDAGGDMRISDTITEILKFSGYFNF